MLIKRILILWILCLGIQAHAQEMSLQEMRETPVPPVTSEALQDADSDVVLEYAIERKQIIEEKAAGVPFLLLPHRPNYLMPISYQFHPNDQPFEDFAGDDWQGLDHKEAVFQLSVKYQIASFSEKYKNRVYVAYTNKSYWQVYNSDLSRPFRETNHEPELITQFEPNWGYVDLVTLALNHQSNGQYTGLSRSWNRIILGLYHRTGSTIWGITPWWRIPETSKADPADPSDNDNPDIEKYMGYGELVFLRAVGVRTLSGRLRNNLRGGNHNRGAVELEWSFPISPRVKGFVQYFDGYGESLIEYDHYQQRLGFGFKISDYL